MRRISLSIILFLSVVAFVLIAASWQNIVAASPLFFGYRSTDLFGIYTARLDGMQFRAVLVDAKREMSHARVSPDCKHITFTRYNRILKDGIAEEAGSGYLHTEVVVANIDGSNQRSIEAVGPLILNANSSWIDNDTIIYVHRSDLTSLPELRIYRLSSNSNSRLPTPLELAVSDPHCVANKVIFPVIPISENSGVCQLWTMDLDGKEIRQLTKAKIKPTSSRFDFKLGDYDLWLSPDATTAVFMRYFGGMDWRIYTARLIDGSELPLTKPGVPSGIPKWASDGKLIIYVCWDRSALEKLGLYTITPAAAQNRKIPLPPGFLYTHPSFFPNTGSSNDAKIIFSARRVPGLPK